jgi:hypothetical protein
MGVTDDDVLARHKRKLEEQYFRTENRELVDRMKRTAAADQEDRELDARTGLHDPELLRQIHFLGFTAETVSLLPLVPLLQVAWARRGIARGERRLILELARARGISEGSAADVELSRWLEHHPPEEVFTRAMHLIRAMLAAHSPETHDLTADDLVRYCEKVAEASGGIFGLARVSVEERYVLGRIAAALQASDVV